MTIITSISGLGLRHLNDVQFEKKSGTLCKAFKSSCIYFRAFLNCYAL